MKSFKELQKDKIILRSSNPLRASVIEIIVDTAFKTAKAENRDEITEEDLVNAVKKQIKATTNAIELIEANKGDASKWKEELSELNTFLPKMLDQEETNKVVEAIIQKLPKEELIKKNMGKIIADIKNKQFNLDMALVSQYLRIRLV